MSVSSVAPNSPFSCHKTRGLRERFSVSSVAQIALSHVIKLEVGENVSPGRLLPQIALSHDTKLGVGENLSPGHVLPQGALSHVVTKIGVRENVCPYHLLPQ